ncbi:sialidase family protein [Micromonospora sp. NPDC049301]|uniref:WD40/YVTN/BNR-like repeat-containing protein n=1 Tax=Micromonospora sp. NPDC049301 TaxID=3155723 RepID=UPI00341AED57
MPDREFSGFDAETVSEAVRQPPLDALRATARFRRQRSVALVATALAALVGVSVVPLVTGPERVDPVGPPEPSPRPDQSSAFTLTGPDSGVDVRRDGCVLRFAVTGDRGRSWSDGDAARFQGTRCEANPTPTVDDLRFSVLSDRSYLVSDAGLPRLSTDYGRTWRDGNEAIVAVPTFPATARPVFCGFGCGALQEPLAVEPSTGTVYRLTGEAPSWRPLFSLYPSSDGTIWATYQMPSPSGATVARSSDRGATWTTWEVGADASVVAVVGVDDREGYLLTEPSTTGGAMRLRRTTDGGQTWTDTGADLPTQTHWDLTVGSDGSLLAITPGGGTAGDRLARLLVSRDDGRHFTVAREYGPVVGALSVAPGYAWLFGRDGGSTGDPDHLLLTTDATSWTRFTLAP